MVASPDDQRRVERLELLVLPRNPNDLGILQFTLDLVGIANRPAGVADPGSAIAYLARGAWAANIAAQAEAFPNLNDNEMLVRSRRYMRIFEDLIPLARQSRECTRVLLPYMERLRDVLRRIGPENGGSILIYARLRVDEFFRVTWAFRIDRHGGEFLGAVRENGSSGGQFTIAGKTSNAADVVDRLDGAQRNSRSMVLKRDAGYLLDQMAIGQWQVTAGPHPSNSDKTSHITLRIFDVDQQYHLRLDNKGILFEVTHPDSEEITGGKVYQRDL
jgi:hypothetical protein